MLQTTRTIALIDMDCFYCQVEEKLNPNLQGKPVAVVQYNLWREGGIIAANYLAKEKGVTKGLWMHEAKELCPDIEFARVPELRGRADLTRYREAGKQVADVIGTFSKHLERASVDEAYLDLTENVTDQLKSGSTRIELHDLKSTHVVGCDTADFLNNIVDNHDTDGFSEADLRLALGAVIVEKIRAEVFEKTGYRCSAGIAHNKMLAKLVSSLHKPNKQTIMPQNSINDFFSKLPLKKIKRLGGKFGKQVATELNIEYVGELLKFSEEELIKKFRDKSGIWLFNTARGIDHEPVQAKLIAKSISCAKQFPGKNALVTQKNVEYWMNELCLEVSRRLQDDMSENNRKAKMLNLGFVQKNDENDVSNSKTCALKSYDAERISRDALEIANKLCRKHDGSYHIKSINISATSFETIKNIRSIDSFFRKRDKNNTISENPDSKCMREDIKNDRHIFDSTDCEEKPNVSDSSILTSKKTMPVNYEHQKNQDSNYILREDEHAQNIVENSEDAFNTQTSTDHCTTRHSFFTSYFDSLGQGRQIIYDNERSEQTKISNESTESPGNDHSNFSKSFRNDEKNTSTPSSSGENSFFERFFKTVPNSSIEENSFQGSIELNREKNNVSLDTTPLLREADSGDKLKERDLVAVKTTKNIIERSSRKDKNAKRRKTDKSGVCSIEVFLTTKSDEEPTETCLECKRKIKITELENHSDYHLAKNLNRELNFQGIAKLPKTKNSRTEKTIVEFLKRKSR